MKVIFLLISLFVVAPAFAADSASHGRFGTFSSAWAGVTAGTFSPQSPITSDLAYKKKFGLSVGGDLNIVGPVMLALDVHYSAVNGTMNYQDANYSASNVDVSQTIAGLGLGLHFRIIDGSFLHLFVEAGGFADQLKLENDFTSATNKTGLLASNFSETPTSLGTYGLGGIDLIIANGYGVRVFGRVAQGSVPNVKSLNGRSFDYVSADGCVAFTQAF